MQQRFLDSTALNPSVTCVVMVTSLRTKVRVFSDIFRHRKTKVAHFTSQFLHNYRLKLYIIQAHTIKEARMNLESLNN